MFGKIINPPAYATLICGGVVGALAFISIYGTMILNPYYDAWLLAQDGDLQIHYIGWLFYNISPWHFPIGLMDGLIYPSRISITYTDSIPLFAIIFKLLSPILGNQFQYFGIFGLFTFIMQGIFATLIIRKFTKNIFICLAASILFIIPPFIWRMYAHTALASHWIILCAIALVVYSDNIKNFKSKIILWSSLMVVATLTHPYFIPMVFLILFFYCIYSIYLEKRLIKHILLLIIPVCRATIIICDRSVLRRRK